MTASTRSRPASRKAADAVCVSEDTIALAREAAVAQEGTAAVGEHLGHDVEADRLVTHYFVCTMPAYLGWRWAVTVARAARAKVATVSEVVLLPGAEALLAPEWVPWAERLKPGDLGPGDLLPTLEGDPRLVPGFTAVDEDEPAEWIDAAAQLGPIGWELGLGRARVFSRHGRDEVSDRWHNGATGPDAPIARSAPANCGTCGFLLPLSGAFAQAFGACANEYSPADGRVVSFDHGCGAHSEVAVASAGNEPATPVIDELSFDLVEVEVTAVEPDEGSVTPQTPAEELGHS